MNPVSDSALDAMHATATGIFTGAVKACSIGQAFDRRIRFEGDTMHRLLPDGSGPDSIDLSFLWWRWARRPVPCWTCLWNG